MSEFKVGDIVRLNDSILNGSLSGAFEGVSQENIKEVMSRKYIVSSVSEIVNNIIVTRIHSSGGYDFINDIVLVKNEIDYYE